MLILINHHKPKYKINTKINKNKGYRDNVNNHKIINKLIRNSRLECQDGLKLDP